MFFIEVFDFWHFEKSELEWSVSSECRIAEIQQSGGWDLAPDPVPRPRVTNDATCQCLGDYGINLGDLVARVICAYGHESCESCMESCGC